MEKRTREIIALVMLLVLGIGVACAMAWYILVGHNWNQAATHIDDMVGSMDGYTVVVFDGVVKKPKDASKKHREGSNDAPLKADDASSGEADDRVVSGDSKNADEAAPIPPSPSSSTSDKSTDSDRADGFKKSLDSESSSQSTPLSGNSESSGSDRSAKKMPTASAKRVAASYEEKGAATVIVDMKSLWKYEEPMILKRSGKRIGIFSSAGEYRRHVTSVRAKVRYLQNHKVDFIIVLADDRSMLSDKIIGADLLLLAKGGGLPGRGGYRGSLFCVDSPYIGEAQSVIISPSLVMTSQTVKEL